MRGLWFSTWGYRNSRPVSTIHDWYIIIIQTCWHLNRLKKKGKNPNKGVQSDSYIEQLGERLRVTSIAWSCFAWMWSNVRRSFLILYSCFFFILFFSLLFLISYFLFYFIFFSLILFLLSWSIWRIINILVRCGGLGNLQLEHALLDGALSTKYSTALWLFWSFSLVLYWMLICPETRHCLTWDLRFGLLVRDFWQPVFFHFFFFENLDIPDFMNCLPNRLCVFN